MHSQTICLCNNQNHYSIFRREKSTPSDDLEKINETESILSESCRSAPSDLRQNSVTDVTSGSRRTLFRSSSTGNNDGLDV